jgi:uncharacterized protein (TIGR00369 family)
MANPLHNPGPEKGQKYFIDVIPYNAELGLKYVENSVGRVVFELPWQEAQVGDPETGVMHGGAITGMFDAGLGGAVLSKLDDLRRIATLDLRIDYLRPARAGKTVRCEAECHRLTKHIAFARGIAHDGDPDDLVATAVGTFVVFRDDTRSHPRESLVEEAGGASS